MPHMLTEKDIVDLIQKNIIQNGKVENAEGIKYDFTLGTRLLKSSYKVPMDINKMQETEKTNLFVEPGEVVFVLSHERLEVPKDIYIELVPKRKLSHDGIMVLGGLSVDPYYTGKLLIGIYNFSSSPFPIQPGKKIIGAHFFQLREDEVQDLKKPEAAIDDFPDELIRLMERYTPVSTLSLSEKITSIDYKLEEFKKEFRDREDWFDRFQKRIEEQEKNIEKLLSGLAEEAKNRRDSDKEIEKEMKSFNTELKQHYKSATRSAVIIGVVGALALSILIWFVQTFIINRTEKQTQQQPAPVNIVIDSAYLNKSKTK